MNLISCIIRIPLHYFKYILLHVFYNLVFCQRYNFIKILKTFSGSETILYKTTKYIKCCEDRDEY